MDERDRMLLERMVEHAKAAIAYKRSAGASWWKDDKTRDAILTRITQVAEAAGQVSGTTAASIPEVPWPAIRGARNRIVHDYARIDVAIIREVVMRDLPLVVRVLTPLLKPF